MNNVCAQAIIMIIDDEPDNLNVLGEMLRHDGWDVRAFPRGEMALAAAREEPPDVVLLDIRMPGVDGLEVCRRLKAHETMRHIPVILISAFAEVKDWVE
ncbi:MAG: response regulator, partial [bacterium]